MKENSSDFANFVKKYLFSKKSNDAPKYLDKKLNLLYNLICMNIF